MVGLVAVQGDTGANGSVSAPHHPSLLISSGPNLDEAQTPIIKFVGSARRGGVTDPVLGESRFCIKGCGKIGSVCVLGCSAYAALGFERCQLGKPAKLASA
eukprot:1156546-Pelagomonas_calceolata.AAC.5